MIHGPHQNFGIAKGEVDDTKHVERLSTGSNGYVNMDAYNRSAPWAEKEEQR